MATVKLTECAPGFALLLWKDNFSKQGEGGNIFLHISSSWGGYKL
jgi:hypothetical protein